jgi:hypothetical protein
MAGDAAVPEVSNRHDGASLHCWGHCTDAPIPALGHDASTPVAPLNAASSTPSALHLLPLVLLPPKTPSPRHGSLCFLHRRIFELGSKASWAPPGQQEQAESPRPLGARSRRPPAQWGADAGSGEPRRPEDLHGLDPSGSCTRRCSECAIAAGGGDAGSPLCEEHRPGALGGRGHSRPPPLGCGHPGAIGGGTLRDRSGRDSPPPSGGGPGTPHRAR